MIGNIEMALRKCKSCGRKFNSKGAGDVYCSSLCRATGFFVGGGGDTTKPGTNAPAKDIHPAPKAAKPKRTSEKFDRVRKMFDLPPSERWELAKDFTEDERAYAKRLERRRFVEEDRIFREWSWDSDEDDICDGGAIGESDDGSV